MRFWPCLLVLGVLGQPVRAADEPIAKVGTVEGCTEYKLANGFRFILIPDDSKPIVTINNSVIVGSRHEGYGEGGMAHLLEHMCCKSTPSIPNIMQAVRAHGATSWNAYTRHDVTNFFETMPANDQNLEFGIRLEADRLVNCQFKRDDLITEMEVVGSEFNKSDNSPHVVVNQKLMAAAFDWHNYGKTVLGNRSDIERYPIESLEAFYKKHYRVDNAVLAIGGKFDEKKALDLVVKHFGALKRPTTPLPVTYTKEAAQEGERQVVLRRVGSVGAAYVLYHVPAATHPDFAAVTVLVNCLNVAPEGRLHRDLVRSKKSANAGAAAQAFHDPGCVVGYITADDEKSVDAARDALTHSMENVAAEPITDAEVNRIKQQLKNDAKSILRSTQALTVGLSDMTALGDWRFFFIQRDRLQQVTAADVNRVAAAYFKRDNRTVGLLYPAEKPGRVEIPEKPLITALVEGYKGGKTEDAVEIFEPTPANIDRRVLRGQLNGTNIKTAYLPKKTRGERVNFSLTLRYGNEASLKGKDTAVSWLGGQLLSGTKNRTFRQIDELMSKLDSTIHSSGGNGWITLQGVSNRDNLIETLRVVFEVLHEPAFPEKEFEEFKRAQIENFKLASNDPEYLASIALSRKLYPYPTGHILARFTVEEGLVDATKTTVRDLKDLYAEQLGASEGEFVVVGDFDPTTVETGLAGLRCWKSKVPYRRLLDVGTPIAKGETIIIRTPDKANAIYLAKLVYPMTQDDPDYAPMMVANSLFGAEPGSRLFNRVRVENGLSYEVDSSFQADSEDKSASFRIRAIAAPDKMDKVKELVADELQKFSKLMPTAVEVAAAKKELLEGNAPYLSDTGNLVAFLREAIRLDRKAKWVADQEDRIRAVTPEDVKRVFNKVVDPKKLVIVEAGDFKK